MTIKSDTCLLVLILLLSAWGCQSGKGRGAEGSGLTKAEGAKLQRYDFARNAMGVEFRIVLFAPTRQKAQSAAQAAFERIQGLDQELSHYKPDSGLNRLVRVAGQEQAQPVSQDLFAVLRLSETYAELSDGAFDITVGPLTWLWRKARQLGRLPDEAELKTALARVGHRKVHLMADGRRVRLELPDMALDLGGIAKGYAVDRALDMLRARGITRALVDGSGDIAVWDAPPNKAGWTIAVSPTGELETRYLILRRGAIATSGDSYGRVVIDGRRYSHIVDPRTGLGLVDSAAVTVLAPDCTQADALATVVSLLGAERGIEVLSGIPETGAIIHRKAGKDPETRTVELQYPTDLTRLPFVLSATAAPDEDSAQTKEPASSTETKK